jgi:hypothetical protein
MTDPIPVTIGGEVIAVPAVMNFATLKRAWPGIKALGEATDLIQRISAATQILSAALRRIRPELSPEELEERLRPGELGAVIEAMPRLLDASGLVPAGEAPPGVSPAAASTASSTN